jgi:pyruvate dehydrogenase E2 component (dihydrolipoamide acetyltransferase)
MKIFKLPDLGEGLPEAELIEWRVRPGDTVTQDQPLASVETAKAVVDLPAPRAGTIARLFVKNGELIHTGDPLLEYTEGVDEEAGTVVGRVERTAESIHEEAVRPSPHGVGAKATPAVRALAHRLEVDLNIVTPTGPEGRITAGDVERAAKFLSEMGPPQPLTGVRRAMAHNMALSHREVVPVTVFEDADVDSWPADADITARLVRALVVGCQAEPALNAWYDGHTMSRRLMDAVHAGIAVDSDEGLFLPVIRNAHRLDAKAIREGLDRIKSGVRDRSLPPEQMRGATISLTNFGTLAGRYGTPVVVPPMVAILGAGMIRPVVVAVNGEPAVHRILPLSLTFDHRVVTGAESSRFLAAVIADLIPAT